MKIVCTEGEKEWLFPLILNSENCPGTTGCNGRTCEQCLNEEIEWVIEPPKETEHGKDETVPVLRWYM